MFINDSTISIEPKEFTLVEQNTEPLIRSGFNSRSLAGNDNESTGLIDIGFEINFYGKKYSKLYVNNNGNITFDEPLGDYTPFALTSDIKTSIIAPFFADVDTTPDPNDPNNIPNVVTYGRGIVGSHPAFGINWDNVGYFDKHYDKLNSFQLIIIDRSDRKKGDFDIEFNYGKINWETGDASYIYDTVTGDIIEEPQNGFGAESARAGFSNGSGNVGTYFEFFGSGLNGYFLDRNPSGLVHSNRNSSINGRYIFAVFDGSPEISTGEPVYVEPLSSIDNYNKSLWGPIGWNPDSGNIVDDPLFVNGFFLSQIDAGQNANSSSVDSRKC